MNSDYDFALLVVFVITAISLYLLPAFIAWRRRHLDVLAIFALNLLLGWTALGWIAALVWSLTGNTRRRATQTSR